MPRKGENKTETKKNPVFENLMSIMKTGDVKKLARAYIDLNAKNARQTNTKEEAEGQAEFEDYLFELIPGKDDDTPARGIGFIVSFLTEVSNYRNELIVEGGKLWDQYAEKIKNGEIRGTELFADNYKARMDIAAQMVHNSEINDKQAACNTTLGPLSYDLLDCKIDKATRDQYNIPKEVESLADYIKKCLHNRTVDHVNNMEDLTALEKDRYIDTRFFTYDTSHMDYGLVYKDGSINTYANRTDINLEAPNAYKNMKVNLEEYARHKERMMSGKGIPGLDFNKDLPHLTYIPIEADPELYAQECYERCARKAGAYEKTLKEQVDLAGEKFRTLEEMKNADPDRFLPFEGLFNALKSFKELVVDNNIIPENASTLLYDLKKESDLCRRKLNDSKFIKDSGITEKMISVLTDTNKFVLKTKKEMNSISEFLDPKQRVAEQITFFRNKADELAQKNSVKENTWTDVPKYLEELKTYQKQEKTRKRMEEIRSEEQLDAFEKENREALDNTSHLQNLVPQIVGQASKKLQAMNTMEWKGIDDFAGSRTPDPDYRKIHNCLKNLSVKKSENSNYHEIANLLKDLSEASASYAKKADKYSKELNIPSPEDEMIDRIVEIKKVAEKLKNGAAESLKNLESMTKEGHVNGKEYNAMHKALKDLAGFNMDNSYDKLVEKLNTLQKTASEYEQTHDKWNKASKGYGKDRLKMSVLLQEMAEESKKLLGYIPDDLRKEALSGVESELRTQKEKHYAFTSELAQITDSFAKQMGNLPEKYQGTKFSQLKEELQENQIEIDRRRNAQKIEAPKEVQNKNDVKAVENGSQQHRKTSYNDLMIESGVGQNPAKPKREYKLEIQHTNSLSFQSGAPKK